VTLDDLVEEPLVLLDLPISREYFLSLFEAAGLRPFVAERTPDLPMVRSMVANGFGYGLMNAPNMDRHAPDGKPLRYVPIEGNHRPLELGLITMRSERESRILTAFEEHCRIRLSANHGATAAADDGLQGGPGKSGWWVSQSGP